MNSRINTKLEVYKDVDFFWRWRLVASNGRIVGASSQGFSQKTKAIKNLKKLLDLLILETA